MIPTEKQRLAVRHRPIGRPVVMFQTWRELLFAHWEIDREVIQRTLPPGLTVDTFDGRAYVGIVPFYMHAIRPRFCPPLPGISYFLETNVRTYVTDRHGRPGVWFYSLEANQRLAVLIARTLFKLPYHYAIMSAAKKSAAGVTTVEYATTRQADPTGVKSVFKYEGHGPVRHAALGSLEFFLAERYLLFAHDPDQQRLFSGQVFHTPYPLQDARADAYSDHLLTLAGFASPARPPDHLLYSAGVTVDVYPLTPIPKF